ncbi:Lrp/AsnC family transcriptional regulator [Mesorhizobium shangrilense]|uniref:Lrp/AsnC family transcriptional regulator n=1 Tax=Mesorhizobium shangrilense TaxID=460060 RepID=UPI003F497D0F
MDDLDRRILTEVQRSNRLSFAELAELVGSSAASCMRRVNKLRAEGVIVADISLVDPKALCKSLAVVVTVELDPERLDLVDDSSARCGQPGMLSNAIWSRATPISSDRGGRGCEAFDVFVKTKLYTNPNVRKFKSMITLDRVKFEPRITVWLSAGYAESRHTGPLFCMSNIG